MAYEYQICKFEDACFVPERKNSKKIFKQSVETIGNKMTGGYNNNRPGAVSSHEKYNSIRFLVSGKLRSIILGFCRFTVCLNIF